MNNIFPDDENGQALQRMHDSGDDLSKPRDVDFSVVFYEESSAVEFIKLVKDMFGKVRYYEVDDEDKQTWDVTATKFIKPSYEEISKTEKYLQSLSERLGGKIDGWGCFNM